MSIEIRRTDRQRWLVLSVFVLFSLYYAVYRYYCACENPWETWLDELPIIDAYYSGTLRFADLLTSYAEHGMLGTNLILLLNARFFSLRTVLNDAINVLMATVFGWYCVKSIISIEFSKTRRMVFFLFVALFFWFSVLQNGSGGMNLQVHIGFFISMLMMYKTNKLLHFSSSDNKCLKDLFILLALIVLSVNVFGSLYSWAAAPAICIYVIVTSLNNRKIDKYAFIIVCALVLCWIAYLFEYKLYGRITQQVSQPGGNQTGEFSILSLFRTLLYYCGSFVLGRAALEDGIIGSQAYMAIGFVCLLAVIAALIVFFRDKQYADSVLPLFLISYTFFIFLMIILGRSRESWLTNAWYYVHTKPAMIGIILIFARKVSKSDSNILTGAICTTLALLLALGILGNYAKWKRVPYEIIWREERMPYFYVNDIEELPVDSNGETPLLHSRKMTMRGIEILKKYHLSIFRYYGLEEQMEAIREKAGQPIQIVSGVYSDNWLAPNAVFSIKAKEEGSIRMSGYYYLPPGNGETFSILLNGETVGTYRIDKQSFVISIPIDAEFEYTLEIQSYFSHVSPPDVRTLSFILSDISLIEGKNSIEDGVYMLPSSPIEGQLEELPSAA